MDIAIVVFTVISGCTTTPRCTRRAPAWCAACIQTPWKLAPSQRDVQADHHARGGPARLAFCNA